MKKHWLIAIDPGASGGVVWGDGTVGTTFAASMPDTLGDLWELLKEVKDTCPEDHTLRGIVERVGGYIGGNTMPGSRAFKFGQGFGHLEAFLYAAEVPVTLVMPQKWQKVLSLGNSAGLTKTQWKNKIKSLAQREFPGHLITLKTSDAYAIYLAAVKGGV